MKKKIIFIALSICLLQCNKHKNIIERIEQRYPEYNLRDFQKPEILESPYDISYIFFNIDSTEMLGFEYYKRNRAHLLKDSIYFLSFEKIEYFEDSVLISRCDENRKVLCAFKQKDNGTTFADTSAIFLIGKYYYYYSHEPSLLTDEQLEFYIKNEDSIIQNGVNEIPDFP